MAANAARAASLKVQMEEPGQLLVVAAVEVSFRVGRVALWPVGTTIGAWADVIHGQTSFSECRCGKAQTIGRPGSVAPGKPRVRPALSNGRLAGGSESPRGTRP
jgi:hypothetical protein